jgi:hypothetical protein
MSESKKRKLNEIDNSQNIPGTHLKVIPAKGAKFHCDYCDLGIFFIFNYKNLKIFQVYLIKNKIKGLTRIRCAEKCCKDFDLCVDCFFVGVEKSTHKVNHKYRVMDDMSAPLFTTSWGAEEELLLLEGIYFII